MRYVNIMILVLTLFTGSLVFAQGDKIDSILPPGVGLVSKELGGENNAPALPPDVGLVFSQKAPNKTITPVVSSNTAIASSLNVPNKKNAPVLPLKVRSVTKKGILENKAYHVGIDDVLNINVINPVPITSSMIVTPDGTITFPYIGIVKAKGRTLSQIQSEIQHRLAAYVNYPVVSVSLGEARSKRFTVYGEVVHPGAYPMESDMSIIRAISLAEGLSVSGSNGMVKVLRPNTNSKGRSVVFESDISEVLSGTKQDFAILSGDTIVVTLDKFFVYGEVNHPGAFPMESGMSIMRAISLAGGLSISGSTGVVKVLRPNVDGKGRSVVFESGTSEVLNGTKQDIAIHSGDSVIVTLDKFFVYGEVNHPGSYPLEENMPLLNAIINAGGFINVDSTGVVKLLRPKGSPREMTFNIKEILSGNYQGLKLQAGDTINVESDKFRIYGQIAHPGMYSVGDNMSIMDAVTAAGGFIDSGSMGRIKIFHANLQKNEDPALEFDINSILDAGNQGAIVRAGDTIVVSLDKFFITGQVNHPGSYPVEKHMSLLNAISTAGGLTADNSTANIKLLRTNPNGETKQQLETDITSVLNGTAPDISIQASDTIVVSANEFYVYGEVNRPGMYSLESKTTAMTAISIAGGFSKFGSGNRVKVVRTNAKTGMYEIIKVNITDAVAGNSNADVLLIPGDVVVVSEGIF